MINWVYLLKKVKHNHRNWNTTKTFFKDFIPKFSNFGAEIHQTLKIIGLYTSIVFMEEVKCTILTEQVQTDV